MLRLDELKPDEKESYRTFRAAGMSPEDALEAITTMRRCGRMNAWFTLIMIALILLGVAAGAWTT